MDTPRSGSTPIALHRGGLGRRRRHAPDLPRRGALCFFLVVAGGLAYSVGAAFFGAKRPKLSPRVFGYHELFHACTVLGAALTFWALAVALR
jgi:hemolysin III